MGDARTLDDLVEQVRDAKRRHKQVWVLIGAGCSRSGGIPTASEIVEQIRAEHPRAYERSAPPKDYARCMAELSPGAQKELVRTHVQHARINWGHIALAQLMHAGYVQRVLTPNFDNLLARACALIGHYPSVYDLASARSIDPAAIADPSVVHLHGQHTGFIVLNTDEKTREQSERLRPLFESGVTSALWIVVGYSGENDPLVSDHLAQVSEFDEGLFWVGHGEHAPSATVECDVLGQHDYAHVIRGFHADGFFCDLAREMGCFPPGFVHAPFSHMDRLLQTVKPEGPAEGGREADLLALVYATVHRAVALFEGEATATVPSREKRRLDADTMRLKGLGMAGEYEAAVAVAARYAPDIPPELREPLAWAYVGWGGALEARAGRTQGLEAEALLRHACDRYAQAVRAVPNHAGALYNWGHALVELAERSVGGETERLLREACARYAEATDAREGFHEALGNWASALLRLADYASGSEADELLRESCQRSIEAIAIKPDDHVALSNYGCALSHRARLASGTEAEALLLDSLSQYAQAHEANPDDHKTLTNWGGALAELASHRSGAEAESLLGESFSKCAAALELNHSDHKALANWATALLRRAELAPIADAEPLYLECLDKCAQAAELAPEYPEAHYNWANALGKLAKRRSSDDARALLEAAFAKYERAHRLGPEDGHILNNWGSALHALAMRTAACDREDLLRQSAERFSMAVDLSPNDHVALSNWGNALSALAELRGGEESDCLFAAGFERYARALALVPKYHVAASHWAGALLRQLRVVDCEKRPTILAEAHDRAATAEELCPGSGAYNLACAASLAGQTHECREWLATCAEHGTLPSRERLETDPDLECVRDTDWFQTVLRQAD